MTYLGVILPNFGADASPDGIREVAVAAEEKGFDSIWTSEHIVLGPKDALHLYQRLYDPYLVLAWLASITERIGLGTSVTLLPLHNTFQLAKAAATLQELSGGRFTMGVGLGSQRQEFDILGVPVQGRGQRADEAIRLLRKLWAGEVEGAIAEPHPSPPPEIWVGGSSDRAIRRALELGDVWHPSGRTVPDDVRRVKAEHPELRVIPRTTPEQLDDFLDAGADGAVLTFPDVAALRAFERR